MELVAELLSAIESVLSSTSVTAMEISLVAVEVLPLESVDVARTLTVWDCADS